MISWPAEDDGNDKGTSACPPKSLLLFLVRMGSFTSTPKISCNDNQDEDDEIVGLSTNATVETLLEKCHKELSQFEPLLSRSFYYVRDVDDKEKTENSFRVMQWNVLSQALGVRNDNFIACPKEALAWKTRRYRMLEEMLVYLPDVLCLQEVDHFNFLNKMLRLINYQGIFFPKPDSPCIYIQGNNGPDGCAIFYNNSKFELVQTEKRIMEVWHVQSNQVVVLVVLRFRETGQEICVVTTHLKARQGTLLSTLRNEQGKDLLQFVQMHCSGRPLIVCGDFNAEPSEPVYSTMLKCDQLQLGSSYMQYSGIEPPYTTWKIREDGEVCHTIDYIFYSKHKMQVDQLLLFPTEDELDENRVPSFRYPSDHFSLVVDFSLNSL